MTRLTTKKYWENYYHSDIKPIKRQITQTCSGYDEFWNILINENDNKSQKTIIEIGGYPGRYLAYLSDKYNLIPTSLDFNSDSEKISQSMEVFDVKEFYTIQKDFFDYTPIQEYDVVISNGFIEHFEDFDDALDRHLLYLKKGGTLFISIPNMRNYIKYYKYLVDKNNLDIHNQKCMKLSVFENFSKRNNLKTLYTNYFGSFPFSVHQDLNFFQKMIFQLHRIPSKFFLNKWIENNPNKYFSSSIIAVYKK